MRNTIGAVAVAAALTVTMALPASAAPGSVECGARIAEDVVLSHDLVCSGTALVVTGDDVTIDLNGHTVRHIGTASGSTGIASVGSLEEGEGRTIDGTTVQRGTIEGYDRSVDMGYTTGALLQRLDMDGSVAAGYSSSFSLLHSRVGDVHLGAYLNDPVVARNRVNGTISVAESGIRVRVADNLVHAGSGIGIHFVYEVRGDIFRNRVRGGAVGIRLGDSTGGVVKANSVHGAGVGVELLGYNGFVTVERNRIVRSRSYGIYSGNYGDQRIVIADNRVIATGVGARPGTSADGIAVLAGPEHEDASGFTLRRNRVTASSGHGINAPGVTDGGGNRASGSRTTPQCIGVACGRGR